MCDSVLAIEMHAAAWLSLRVQGERLARDVDASSAARFEALRSRVPQWRAADIIDPVECLVSTLEESSGSTHSAEISQ
jgi:hypothetical protein